MSTPPTSSCPTNKVTIDAILAKIKDVRYTILDDKRTMLCQLTLENGFTVLGHSAVVDAKNFDHRIGEKYSFDAALHEIWPLEGYLLAEKMHLDRLVQSQTADAGQTFPTISDAFID